MPNRLRLPNRRPAETLGLRHHGAEYLVSLGYRPNGAIGEVFINSPKVGSEGAHLATDVAILISLALQFGVPAAVLQSAMGRAAPDQPHSIAGAVLDLMVQESGS